MHMLDSSVPNTTGQRMFAMSFSLLTMQQVGVSPFSVLRIQGQKCHLSQVTKVENRRALMQPYPQRMHMCLEHF